MNQLKRLCKLLGAATVFFLFSCANNSDNASTETSDSDSTVSAPEPAPAPANTIVTTPQHMMLVRHKVANYEKWIASFEAHDSMKHANGIHNYVVGRSVDDPNMLMVATKVDDMDRAKAFGKDPELKKAMQKGGVTGTPTFRYVTTAFQDTATVASNVRSMTTFTVKDWDAWRTSFDSGRQIRMDNGLADRMYGYDPEDNHKVTLVVAVLDSARAEAFWKSDQIKQLRAKSGVVGQPQRFIFRVTKRY